jgi:large subunit ribosomal protein L25
MAETKSLAASVRSGVGKGAARSVRREGRIPAVVYGGGEPPTPISLSWHEVNKLIYAGHFMTTTFELDVDGAKERVIPRDYQLDRIKDRPLHVDFLRLKKGQRIDVEIPLHVVGQERAPGLKRGGILNIAQHVLELNVVADAIPEHVEIDISTLEIGDSVHVSELTLPGGARLSTSSEAETTVLTLAAPLVEQEADSAKPEGGAAGEGAEKGDKGGSEA